SPTTVRLFPSTPPAPAPIYTLSLHDALPISVRSFGPPRRPGNRTPCGGRRRCSRPRRSVRTPGGDLREVEVEDTDAAPDAVAEPESARSVPRRRSAVCPPAVFAAGRIAVRPTRACHLASVGRSRRPGDRYGCRQGRTPSRCASWTQSCPNEWCHTSIVP